MSVVHAKWVLALVVAATAGLAHRIPVFAGSSPVRADVLFEVQDSVALSGPLAGQTFVGEAVWDADAVDPLAPLQALTVGSGLIDLTVRFGAATFDETDGVASGVFINPGDPVALIVTDAGVPVGLDFKFTLPGSLAPDAVGSLNNNLDFTEFAFGLPSPPDGDGFGEGRIAFGPVTAVPNPAAASAGLVALGLVTLRRRR